MAGPTTPEAAASRMLGYITPYQIDAGRFPLTLHSRDLPPGAASAHAALQRFVDELSGYLSVKPKDHRNHPDWLYHKEHVQQYHEEKTRKACAAQPQPGGAEPAAAPSPCVSDRMGLRDPIVDLARRHLDRALGEDRQRALPDYGSRWTPQVEAIRRDLVALTDRDACLHYAQYNITFDGRPPFPNDASIVQFHEWAVQNEFPQYANDLLLISENLASGGVGQFNGRLVSLAMYYHARNVLAGITYANKPKRILEIGGGYGEIARLWVKNPIASATSYVVVDIPECLFLAEVALRSEFGEMVGYLEGTDPGTPILLVPLSRLFALKRTADLVVNTGSMQEMTEEWIDFYVDWLSRYDARYFYSLNYAAQPISIMGESRNLWTQRLGPEWSTRHLRLNIPLMDLAGPTRDFLECFYEKTPSWRSLHEWSVYRGHLLSKTTYVEGLDLLRQSLTVQNAKAFVDLVLQQMPYHPKELLYVAQWLVRNGADEYEPICAMLQKEFGGELRHEPPRPEMEMRLEAKEEHIPKLEYQCNAEREAAAARIRELENQRDAEREAAVARIRELENQVDAISQAASAQAIELQTRAEAERSASIDRIRELEIVIESERSAFLSSMSWRITAPLRRASHRLRRFKLVVSSSLIRSVNATRSA